jgi:hypothetical protein
MTQILNLTPHDIHIVDDLGNVTHTFPKSGDVLRLNISTTVVDNDGIPTVKRVVTPLEISVETEYDPEEDYSSPRGEWVSISSIDIRFPSYEGIIVSAQVAEQLKYQGFDALEVFTVGDTVKNSQGAIIGTKFLVLN